ncbi:MAG: VacJ family lipoprotein [Nitrospirae bacterium]|nr:VacJ family lipoprotein [Nitrospirota bacterium]
MRLSGYMQQGGVMRLLLTFAGIIVLLAAPYGVSADTQSDSLGLLSLPMDGNYPMPQAADASFGGVLDVNDEILLFTLFDESEQGEELSEDGQGVILAMADGIQADTAAGEKGSSNGSDYEDSENNRVADPLYYWNVAMYHFNDKFYFWLTKPVARGYTAIAPEPVRIAVSNFFHNLTTPVRFVGNLLQLRLANAGNELVRFITNSTQGLGGFMDVAKSHYGITLPDEDIGQALGSYGIGHGLYLVWPIFGPSSLRDTVGLAGDILLNPVTYVNPVETSLGIRAYDEVNETTFHIGDYESMKEAAIDPYVSMRNGYLQHRRKQVEE